MSRILPFIVIILAILLVALYVVPTYTNTITSEQQQIQSYQSALVAAQTFTQRENELLAQENAIPANELARLETFMPDGVNNIQLIVDLNALATKSGLVLSNFVVQDNSSNTTSSSASSSSTTPSTPAVSGTPTAGSPLQSTSVTNSLSLQVSATGTYSAFRTFLAATEQSLRPLDVTEVSITDSATGVYTYQITFRIYWLQ